MRGLFAKFQPLLLQTEVGERGDGQALAEGMHFSMDKKIYV